MSNQTIPLLVHLSLNGPTDFDSPPRRQQAAQSEFAEAARLGMGFHAFGRHWAYYDKDAREVAIYDCKKRSVVKFFEPVAATDWVNEARRELRGLR